VRFDFAGHHAVVTGGCRGIGRAIADALAAAGAGVEVFDVDGPADGSAFLHRVTNVDVSDTVAVRAALVSLRRIQPCS
jgi:NAD(P)-dependent dehydrogenase (short-subunit alcohol dehydrogenase family)